jgi:hypothetical protein
MLKTAGRESRNPTLDQCENFALKLSLTGLKKALNLLTKKLQEPCIGARSSKQNKNGWSSSGS